jgi:hypothetical protein
VPSAGAPRTIRAAAQCNNVSGRRTLAHKFAELSSIFAPPQQSSPFAGFLFLASIWQIVKVRIIITSK